MEKKNYVSPTVSYVGPDITECLDTAVPAAAAVGASVAVSVATTITSRIW
jgi:hypothetical protein